MNLVESNPKIMMGKPVISGTRITVESILERLAAGETPEQIVAAHPRLTLPAIYAALEFGARALRADVVYPLEKSGMNLLCDEGVDSQIVEQLRADGHAVLYVIEMKHGITDDEVLQTANEHGALLITEDKDFGELVFRQGLVHRGVVLIRLMGLASASKARLVANVFQLHSHEMPHAFTVIAPGSVRLRRVI